jgi:nitroreductase/ferredoxin
MRFFNKQWRSAMAFVTVDQAKCKRDGTCIKVCPTGVLESDPDKLPRGINGKTMLCMKCGHCVAVCGPGALAIEGISPQDCEEIREEFHLSAQQLEGYFKSRRSVRLYQDKQVPREVLEKVLDGVRWAPTAKNAQVVEWVAIDEPKQLRKLAEQTIEFMRPNAGAARMVKAWDAGQDSILRSAPLLVIAHAPTASYNPTVDGTIALAHLELLAGAAGLGGCWVGVFMAAVKGSTAVRQSLRLPEGHEACGAMVLGYPRIRYKRIPPRQKSKIQWR